MQMGGFDFLGVNKYTPSTKYTCLTHDDCLFARSEIKSNRNALKFALNVTFKFQSVGCSPLVGHEGTAKGNLQFVFFLFQSQK